MVLFGEETTKEAREVTRKRGIKRYQRMRKAEFVQSCELVPNLLIPGSRSATAKNVVDQPSPEIGAPVLPTSRGSSRIKSSIDLVKG